MSLGVVCCMAFPPFRTAPRLICITTTQPHDGVASRPASDAALSQCHSAITWFISRGRLRSVQVLSTWFIWPRCVALCWSAVTNALECSAYDYTIEPRGKELVKTDIAIALPDGCYGRIGACGGVWEHWTSTTSTSQLMEPRLE